MQAFYRQERFQEAADLYAKLMQDGAPTPMLSRGYGLSLARQGQFGQAYKHLRLALEQEDPKDPFTAGYLALCGAMGKPTNPADKPKNLGQALEVARATFPGDGQRRVGQRRRRRPRGGAVSMGFPILRRRSAVPVRRAGVGAGGRRQGGGGVRPSGDQLPRLRAAHPCVALLPRASADNVTGPRIWNSSSAPRSRTRTKRAVVLRSPEMGLRGGGIHLPRLLRRRGRRGASRTCWVRTTPAERRGVPTGAVAGAGAGGPERPRPRGAVEVLLKLSPHSFLAG